MTQELDNSITFTLEITKLEFSQFTGNPVEYKNNPHRLDEVVFLNRVKYEILYIRSTPSIQNWSSNGF
mgnify:CR=1 FL=1